MRRFFAAALAFALILAAGWAAARIGLVTIPSRQDIRIKIDRNNNALVQERRGITLKEGMNRIEFSWPNMQIDFNTAQLLPLEQQDSISIRSLSVPPNAANTLILEVESQQPSLIPFRITYLTSGISWQASYTSIAEIDEKTIDLEASVTIANNTVEDYHDAAFALPVGKPFRQFIQSGESKKIVLFSARGIPVQKTYLSDPRQFPDAAAMHYVFANGEASGLKEGMLLPGRVRQFKKDATGSVAFVGEDLLRFVPVGDEIRLYQGPARDIEVERRVMNRERKAIKRNKKGQIVSYDTDETYRITVHNRKLTDAPLVVRAYLSHYWEMKEHSDPYERQDVSTIEFETNVPSRSEKEILFRVEGKNLQNGFVLSE